MSEPSVTPSWTLCSDKLPPNNKEVLVTYYLGDNTKKRYEALHLAVKENAYGRVEKVKRELEKLYEFEQEACDLQKFLNEGNCLLG